MSFNLNFSVADCEEIRTGIRAGARGITLDSFDNSDDFHSPYSSSSSLKRTIDWPSQPPSLASPWSPAGSAGNVRPQETRVIRAFTDGSCLNNGKKNSIGGIGIHFPDGEIQDVSLPYLGYLPSIHGHDNNNSGPIGPKGPIEPIGQGAVTNQRAELTAIYHALQLIDEHRRTSFDGNDGNARVEIHIYTDSKYSIESLTNWSFGWKDNGWKTANGKPVKNRDILEPVLALMKQGFWNRVIFFHSEAHTNRDDERSRGNARADLLATQATRSQAAPIGAIGAIGAGGGQRLVRRRKK